MTARASARSGWQAALLIGALVVGLTLLGLLAGLAVGDAAANGALSRWQRLPDPPEPAAEILAGGTELSNDSWYVYIRGARGGVYACPPGSDGGCWAAQSEPLDLPVERVCEQPANFEAPPPPGRAVDMLTADACHFEAGYQVRFAVLADGSVWRWTHFASGLSALATWLFAGACGAAAGLMLAAAVAVVVLVRRRRAAA